MKYFIAGFIGVLILFAFFAFTAWSLNIGDWHWTVRALFAFFLLIWGGYLNDLQSKEK